MLGITEIRDLPLTLTIEEAGRLAGLNRQSAYGAAARGDMPTITLNGRKRVPTKPWLRILNGEGAVAQNLTSEPVALGGGGGRPRRAPADPAS